MHRDLVSVFLSSALAAFNPSLLAAVTVMLLTFGLVFAFSLHGSSAVSTSQHALSPGGDILGGAIAIGISYVLATCLDARLRSWQGRRKQAKGKAKQEMEGWQLRLLGRGSMRVTFAVGVVLSFPGSAISTRSVTSSGSTRDQCRRWCSSCSSA